MLLSRRDKMARGKVICWKHDVNCNPDGKFNQNPIQDTHLHEVEFLGGDMTELAPNIVEDSMYAHCDVYGNEYLLLEAFVNHR